MDTIILALQSLFKTAVAVVDSPLTDIKRVFYGDYNTIPESDLPAITIEPVETQYEFRGNKLDTKVYTILVKLVYNRKDFFSIRRSKTTTNITNASWLADVITFTSPTHGLTAGNEVVVQSVLPIGYNGTYKIVSTPTASTFTVVNTTDPGTYVASSGTVREYLNDIAFAVQDSTQKTEEINDSGETIANTVAGVIMKNITLPYLGINRAQFMKVGNVTYTDNTNRPFPTWEVQTSVEVTVVADR